VDDVTKQTIDDLTEASAEAWAALTKRVDEVEEQVVETSIFGVYSEQTDRLKAYASLLEQIPRLRRTIDEQPLEHAIGAIDGILKGIRSIAEGDHGE